MKSSGIFVATVFLCLVAFPSTTVGKNVRFWPKPKPNEGWPNLSKISRSNMAGNFNYGDSKVWKCTYSNGSAPAISISPATPFPSTPTTPSSPPPTPKMSPPPSTPSSPPPTPKKSPSPPPLAPKRSLPHPTPALPPQTPKESPSPSPPSDDTPSNPPHHNSPPRHQNRWEHLEGCTGNTRHATMCRVQMKMSFYARMFRVSDRCCNLILNMKNECDKVVWGFFTDPFFLPLVRCTCHVSY